MCTEGTQDFGVEWKKNEVNSGEKDEKYTQR